VTVKSKNSHGGKLGKNIIILAIALGIMLRMVNLGAKPYWMDECYTLLRVSGHTFEEAKTLFLDGKTIKAGDMLRFQQPSPIKGIRGTLKGLAQEEPQHPPLFFLLTRQWAEMFGNSKATMRTLPALFGILGIPAVFWLSWEIWRDRAIAGLATAFYSLSPILIQYSQAARQYSLWLTLMTVASALLVRFLRRPKEITWMRLYGITMAIAFYVHLFSGLILLGHGVYVVLHEKLRLNLTFKRWIGGSLLTLGVASLWLRFVWHNRASVANTTSWMKHFVPWSRIVYLWDLSLSKSFFALHFNNYQASVAFGVFLAIITIYAFYFCFTHSPAKSWGIICVLAGMTFLPFLLADLIWGGRRVISERYFLLCFICIYWVMAFMLVSQMRSTRYSLFWQCLTLCLLLMSLGSSASGVFATSWWGWSEYEKQIPQVIQQVKSPLVVVPEPFYDGFRFAHEFKPDVEFLFIENVRDLQLPPYHHNLFFIFTYPTSNQLKFLTELGIKLKPAYYFYDPSTSFELAIYQGQNPNALGL
jgi:uncharacterized membrane protein